MSFAKIDEALEMPNLIEVQIEVLQLVSERRIRGGSPATFPPITDYSGNLSIEFVDFRIDPNPKYPVEECKERDVNDPAPLRVEVRLFNKSAGELLEREYIPWASPARDADNGTFVMNGAGRVIVSQIVRSPRHLLYTSTMVE